MAPGPRFLKRGLNLWHLPASCRSRKVLRGLRLPLIQPPRNKGARQRPRVWELITWNNWKCCLSKGYKISCPFLWSSPGFFQGKNTHTQGMIFKWCLVLRSLLELYTPALLPRLKPGPCATKKICVNAGRYVQNRFFKGTTQKSFFIRLKKYI